MSGNGQGMLFDAYKGGVVYFGVEIDICTKTEPIGPTGRIKIGSAGTLKNLKERMSSHRTGNPQHLACQPYHEEHCEKVEDWLKQWLEPFRVPNAHAEEWFFGLDACDRLSEQDLLAGGTSIEELAFQLRKYEWYSRLIRLFPAYVNWEEYGDWVPAQLTSDVPYRLAVSGAYGDGFFASPPPGSIVTHWTWGKQKRRAVPCEARDKADNIWRVVGHENVDEESQPLWFVKPDAVLDTHDNVIREQGYAEFGLQKEPMSDQLWQMKLSPVKIG